MHFFLLKHLITFAQNGIIIKNTALPGISCKVVEEARLVKIKKKLLLQNLKDIVNVRLLKGNEVLRISSEAR